MDNDGLENYDLNYTDNNGNKVASFLKILSWIIVIIGFIIPFIPRLNETRPQFIPTVSYYILLAAILRGMAEIVQLLHSINSKIK
ncbi:hypothetical protein RAC89_22855 [Paenibacillus sp. GD4]|uniref:hypothetical protein n=1 Tax=Paenibacillus sp. GD4 TaxID=3068890 RepID=UPI0027965265|nr:hypothetical protein [Paenibacillus sp. GD4]MDQ1913241.1 hypothetical protein [Paenibacillus sp. GD4]